MHKQDLHQDDALALRSMWWLFMLTGLASVVAGAILVAKPSNSLATLAVVAGIFLLVDGTVELVASLGSGAENRTLGAIVGVLGIIVGITLVRHPLHGVAAIGILIGIWLVASGVIRLVRAIVEGQRPFLRAAIALIEIVAGIAVVSDPHIGYATLAVLYGIWLIVNGIGTIVFAVAVRGVAAVLAPDTASASQSAA